MEIKMLDFAEINIGDKALFDRYLKCHNPQVSELTFTNLFMWRNYYRCRYIIINDFLCVIAVPEGKEPFSFMPLGVMDNERLEDTVHKLKEYFTKKGWQLRFSRIAEGVLGYFRTLTNSEDDIALDRDNSDYIYLTGDMTNLSGKKYDGKRNHINNFKKLYEFEYVPMNDNHIEDCRSIMEGWCSERSCEDHKALYCEKLANYEALDNFLQLSYKGALIKVNGRFEAFTIGEMLNSDTAVIHIEKANSKIKGLYTFINQQFCSNEWEQAGALYINREQDLGIEGLRKAKMSYHPVKLVDKYSVVIK
ncbi:MAG: phosphatidylglycerol lysyltransferase domain-containing protein [Clostridia bacterium]|nr:phosphatidylglycerol lysyltransferase domain-containing protein [Clostridia bacterium]